jgi:CheY-like chemotaxis protein
VPEHGPGPVSETARPLALVADDHPEIRALVADALAEAGFRAATAADGLELLDLAERLRPALIVADVMMPGLDGYSAIARLRGRPATAGIPVIVITGHHDPAYARLSEGIGAAAHVTKPFSPLELAAVVRRVVAGAAA